MPSRILKEVLLTSKKLNTVSAVAERLYTRLLLVVDDFGRCEAEPRVIASGCFPRRGDPGLEPEVRSALNELAEARLVDLYEVRGDLYLQINNFTIHNKPRADKSKCPGKEIGQSLLMLASAGDGTQKSPYSYSQSFPPVDLSSADADPLAPGQVSEDLFGQPDVPKDAMNAAIDRVLDHWKAKHGGEASITKGKAGEKRRKRVKARLDEGTTADECILALDGALKDPYLMGTDPRSPRQYRDVDTLLRDRPQVERLMKLAVEGVTPKPSTQVQFQTTKEDRPYSKPAPKETILDWDAYGELSRAANRPAAMGGMDVFKLPENRELPPDLKLPEGMKVVRIAPYHPERES